MKLIVFNKKEGGVALTIPTGDIPIEEVMKKDVPENSGAMIVEKDQLPFYAFDYFDAWEIANGGVQINLEKAKEVKKRMLRIEREPLLAKLDVDFQRAIEAGGDTKAIVVEKQRLRDVTNLVNNVENFDDLTTITC